MSATVLFLRSGHGVRPLCRTCHQAVRMTAAETGPGKGKRLVSVCGCGQQTTKGGRPAA